MTEARWRSGAERTPGRAAAATPTPISSTGWWALAIACSTLVVAMLDSSGINLAFPFIEDEFPTTARSTLAWIPSVYWIVLAALLLPAGRWADGAGRRRAFVIGMTVFATASLATAVAPGPGLMIAARAVQGGGSAFMTATALAIALPALPADRRAFAVGVFGTTGAVAAALGPPIGAIVVELVGWRAVFVVSVPLALGAAALAPRVVDETTVPGTPRHLDPVGTILGAVVVAGLTLAVLQAPVWGVGDGRTLIVVATVAVLGPLFVARSARAIDPLMDLSLLAERRFLVGNLNQMATQLAIFAWFISTPLFLINVWGWSALRTGLTLAIPMLLASAAIPAGRWADLRGHRPVLVTGGLVTAAGTLWWLAALDETPSFVAVLPGLVAFGIGAGVAGTTGTSASLHLVGDERLGRANALHQMLRRLAQGLGPAVALSVLGSREAESIDAYRRAWWVIAGGYLLSAAIAAFYPRPTDP